eukprot:928-Pelagomonas_calceolata.AAC.5
MLHLRRVTWAWQGGLKEYPRAAVNSAQNWQLSGATLMIWGGLDYAPGGSAPQKGVRAGPWPLSGTMQRQQPQRQQWQVPASSIPIVCLPSLPILGALVQVGQCSSSSGESLQDSLQLFGLKDEATRPTEEAPHEPDAPATGESPADSCKGHAGLQPCGGQGAEKERNLDALQQRYNKLQAKASASAKCNRKVHQLPAPCLELTGLSKPGDQDKRTLRSCVFASKGVPLGN